MKQIYTQLEKRFRQLVKSLKFSDGFIEKKKKVLNSGKIKKCFFIKGTFLHDSVSRAFMYPYRH